MDRNYLLTFSYEDKDGKVITTYEWYEDEDELLNEVDVKRETLKHFIVNEAMKVVHAILIEEV